MPLRMIRNDITRMQVDAIVNPSNQELRMGRGTSYAIFMAADEKKLTKACQKIGYCEIGKAVITKGFQLPAKYVIHAVCPPWKGGSEANRTALVNTYRFVLNLAAKRRVKTIAIPLLSSGFYGWPKAEALHLATMAISEFLLEHEMTVYLVLYDHESVEVSKNLVSKIEEYIDDHYVEEKSECYFCKASMSYGSESSDTSIFLEKNAPIYKSVYNMKSGSEKQIVPKNRSLDALMARINETFSQMLLRLIDERGLKDSMVYHKANIDRRLFSKIRKDIHYAPTKKTVLAFAIALELSLDETKDLLMKAGYAFSNCSKYDMIISFFIENNNYNIFEINEVLFFYEQPILGE